MSVLPTRSTPKDEADAATVRGHHLPLSTAPRLQSDGRVVYFVELTKRTEATFHRGCATSPWRATGG